MSDEHSGRVAPAPKPVHLVLGSARPLVLEAVARLEAETLARVTMPVFNHDTFRCTEGTVDRALEAARTPPMLGERRLVVVREIGEATDAFLEALEQYLERPSPTTTLVLTGDQLPKQEKGRPAWMRRIPEAVKKAKGEVLELDERSVDPQRFAADRAAALGKKLDPGAARLLVETIGRELDRLGNEVDKLVNFVGASPAIEVDHVRAACALLAEAEVWDLTAALAARDRPAAIAALYRLQAIDEEPRRVLSMIAWQARQLLEMAELVRAGASDDAVQRSSRMRWDTFRRVRPILAEGRVPPAADLLSRLAEANLLMNSSRASAERILDALVLEMLL